MIEFSKLYNRSFSASIYKDTPSTKKNGYRPSILFDNGYKTDCILFGIDDSQFLLSENTVNLNVLIIAINPIPENIFSNSSFHLLEGNKKIAQGTTINSKYVYYESNTKDVDSYNLDSIYIELLKIQNSVDTTLKGSTGKVFSFKSPLNNKASISILNDRVRVVCPLLPKFNFLQKYPDLFTKDRNLFSILSDNYYCIDIFELSELLMFYKQWKEILERIF